MDRGNLTPSALTSEHAGLSEFQLSLLRVAAPGEPPSPQAIELEDLLHSAELLREPLQ